MSNNHPGPTPGDMSTVARQLPEVNAPALTALRVVVIEGPDLGQSFLIDPESPQRVLVGTSPACEVRLTDPMVSRRHAALEPLGKRYRIADLGSTNGTFVDGTGIVEAFLRGEEVVRCGSTALRVEMERRAPGAPLPSGMRFGKTIGASAAMRRLYPLCERLAMTRVSVLIEGETGTGKEVLAESLHGERGAFVVFDCTNTPPAAVEAELFGIASSPRASSPELTPDRPGAFEEAHGGTLFIDEIGDLPLSLQPKLLRVLERGEVRRVGSQQGTPILVRVLAATRRDLDREVAAGRFRDDLLRRIAIARVELPPLRERHGDITLLARYFAERVGAAPDALTTEVLAQFEDYAWPGNVRELYHAVARRIAIGEVTLGEDTATGAGGRPRDPNNGFIDQMIRDKVPYPIARRRALDAFERHYVEKILEMHGGSVAKASAASGLARRYFQLVKARSTGG